MIASPYSVELQIASLLSVSGMCMLFMCLWYASSGVYHCCSSGERSASVVHGSLSAVTWPPACCVQSPIPALWTVRALGECKSWLLEVVEAVSRGRHDHTNFNKVSPSVTSWLLEHQWPAPTISALQFNHFRLLFHHYCVYLFFFFSQHVFLFFYFIFSLSIKVKPKIAWRGCNQIAKSPGSVSFAQIVPLEITHRLD